MLVVLLIICWCGVVAVGWSGCTLLHMHANYLYLPLSLYIYIHDYVFEQSIYYVDTLTFNFEY